MGAEALLGVKTLRRCTRRYSSQRDEFHHHATDTHADGQMAARCPYPQQAVKHIPEGRGMG